MTRPDWRRSLHGWSALSPCAVAGCDRGDAADRLRAGRGRTSPPRPGNARHPPASARSGWAADARIPGCCRRPGWLRAQPGSVHCAAPVAWLWGGHQRARRSPRSSVAGCAGTRSAPCRPTFYGHLRRRLRSAIQRVSAVLAAGSVVLAVVAPVGVQLFSQHQNRCRLGQRLVLAAQLALQLTDAFLVCLGLLALGLSLRLCRLLAADARLPPGLHLLGVEPLTSS